MNRITEEFHSDRTKVKGCLLRQILTKDLNTVRYDLGGCNSAVEYLLPKQDVEGSNPFTRSTKLSDDLHSSKINLRLTTMKGET